ncbi:Hpt domain-containing protein [Inhella proteolytica]|uniref:Hpt domain-containing protein n=1 Tax=Inhella proteolytica TaxID=2795029 RepID=A0A931IXC8_9BURK|nr:Hpt domain-containing protein [Inhella proteolytica]MBH9575469.1 Hpt domain-containing protein [Inhella proteolytica]
MSPAPPPAPTPAPPSAAAIAHEQAVADAYFRGNLVFFRRFRQDCLQQFVIDLAEGERSAQQEQLDGLMHLGHSLKTVLRLIGDEPLADWARQLELSARAADAAASRRAWAALAAGLQQVLASHPQEPGA